MSESFELNAEPRVDYGTNASRRLRRQGKVPAVLYGAGQDPQALSLEHREVLRHLEDDAFYSQILQINIGGSHKEQAVLRDLQRHPYKPAVLHMDLLRVSEHEKVRVHVPLHFLNQETAQGVKLQGGVISHHRIELEIACLPKDLPEHIEVDLKNLTVGEAIHLSDIPLPPGVEIPELLQGAEYDVPVVSIHGTRGTAAEDTEEGGEGAE